MEVSGRSLGGSPMRLWPELIRSERTQPDLDFTPTKISTTRPSTTRHHHRCPSCLSSRERSRTSSSVRLPQSSLENAPMGSMSSQPLGNQPFSRRPSSLSLRSPFSPQHRDRGYHNLLVWFMGSLEQRRAERQSRRPVKRKRRKDSGAGTGAGCSSETIRGKTHVKIQLLTCSSVLRLLNTNVDGKQKGKEPHNYQHSSCADLNRQSCTP